MVELPKERLKKLVIFFAAFLFSTCANQLPPGGGDVDRIPPEIIEIYPADGTTNFNDEYFEITFSEYVDKRAVKDAIFISPALEGELELNWSGKSVEVYFPEKLRENVTYIITIGTDVVDYNNKNRMAEAYTLTFSTGDIIDRRKVAGRIYDEKPEGIMLFAYKVDGEDIDPSAKKPDYISQTGTDGSFLIAGLAEGTYRIFAIQDEFRDLLYQKEQDKFGAPFKDIILAENDSLFYGLNFFLSKEDTTAPRVISAAMTDANHVLVNFSEEVDERIFRSTNFSFYDSTSDKSFKPVHAFKGNTKPTEMVLSIKENLAEGNSVYLFIDSVIDKKGNIFTKDFAALTVNNKIDTTAASIYRTNPPSGTNDAELNFPKFEFYLNEGIDTASAKNGITYTDTLNNKIPHTINFIDDARFVIITNKKLEAKKDFRIKMDLNFFTDAAGNKLDSIMIYNFRTGSGLDATGVSGSVVNIDLTKNPIIILQQPTDKKKKYIQKIKENGRFNFDKVDPGKYLLWAYLDSDSSGNYNYGYPFPFKSAEQFSFYQDTLNLRPRWVQTDILFNFLREE